MEVSINMQGHHSASLEPHSMQRKLFSHKECMAHTVIPVLCSWQEIQIYQTLQLAPDSLKIIFPDSGCSSQSEQLRMAGYD